MSERGAISPERDEIVGERGAELSGAVCCDFEQWSGGANTHVSREREFSPLSSAHMLWSGHMHAQRNNIYALADAFIQHELQEQKQLVKEPTIFINHASLIRQLDRK